LYALSGAEAFAAQQPIEHLIDPAEVGALVAWLAGPDSGAVTGTDHAIDDGLAVVALPPAPCGHSCRRATGHRITSDREPMNSGLCVSSSAR
jgi:hypothetical protein